MINRARQKRAPRPCQPSPLPPPIHSTPPLLSLALRAPLVCAGLQRSGADLSPQEYATSQREAPKDLAGVLDESANILFLTELWRGLAMTLKVFFEPPVTVSNAGIGRGKRAHLDAQRRLLQLAASRHDCCRRAGCGGSLPEHMAHLQPGVQIKHSFEKGPHPCAPAPPCALPPPATLPSFPTSPTPLRRALSPPNLLCPFSLPSLPDQLPL